MRFLTWRARPNARTLAAEPFTEERIRRAPNSRGIYQLYRDGVLLYAGAALSGIRRELEHHRRGDYGPCTCMATGFHYEVTGDPEAALRGYLRIRMAANGGRLPPCNRPTGDGQLP